APNGLKLQLSGQRIVFQTPNHGMKKENYVRIEGRCSAAATSTPSGVWFTLQEETGQHRTLRCFTVKDSPAFAKAQSLTVGTRYRVGGLGALDMTTLTATNPAWQAMFSPALEITNI